MDGVEKITIVTRSATKSADAHDLFRERWANWRQPTRVHITFDVDWAPDFMIAHVLQILEPYPIGATFFATHETALLKEIGAQGRHEVGFHPNLSDRKSVG